MSGPGHGRCYRGRTLEELRTAFEGFPLYNGVAQQVYDEWERWKDSEAANGGVGREFRHSFSLTPDHNFCKLWLNRAEFSGRVDNPNYLGRTSKEITVYRNCIAPCPPIYMKRG